MEKCQLVFSTGGSSVDAQLIAKVLTALEQARSAGSLGPGPRLELVSL